MPLANAERARLALPMGEIVRFLVSGGVATLGNVAAVWAARHYMAYDRALLAGIAVGATLSFLLSKLFAFRSKSWRGAHGELGRFAIVYGCGVVLYWLVSMMFGHTILPRVMARAPAELLGVLIGAGVMTVTSYAGHRFFTYRGRTSLG